MPSLRVWLRDNLFSRYKQAVAPGEIRSCLASSPASKLNIGAGGNHLDGWLNVDLFPPPEVSYMNGARRWPFADGTFHASLCEHVIEHVSKDVGRHFISEAFRTLKPGTKFRIVTPDLDFFAGAVLRGAPEADVYLRFLGEFTKSAQPLNWCDAINLNFYEHGHCYIYTPGELAEAAKAIVLETATRSRGYVFAVGSRARHKSLKLLRSIAPALNDNGPPSSSQEVAIVCSPKKECVQLQMCIVLGRSAITTLPC
jgi:SAM-dependent methyltransferase